MEEAEEWLSKRLERVSEKRRAILHDLKPGLEQVVDSAQTIAKADPQIDSLFAELFDYLAEPFLLGL